MSSPIPPVLVTHTPAGGAADAVTPRPAVERAARGDA
jgi:hypothetical protein